MADKLCSILCPIVVELRTFLDDKIWPKWSPIRPYVKLHTRPRSGYAHLETCLSVLLRVLEVQAHSFAEGYLLIDSTAVSP